MKIKKTYFFILFLVLLGTVAIAQNNNEYWNYLNKTSNRLQGKLTGEIYYISSEANSNFFLQKEWVKATIVLEDDDVFNNVKVRYLAYGDELIAYNENVRSLYTVDKETIKAFYFSDNERERKFIKLYFDGINGGNKFYELLYSGNRLLLAFHRVEQIKVSPYADMLGVVHDTKFRMTISYSMYSKKNGFSKLFTRKSSFIKTIPEHKKEIRKIFRQNKIMLSDEKSMIQAFDLLDKAELLN